MVLVEKFSKECIFGLIFLKKVKSFSIKSKKFHMRVKNKHKYFDDKSKI